MSRVRDNGQGRAVVPGDISATVLQSEDENLEAYGVTIAHPQWDGYSFNLTLTAGVISSIEINRADGAAPINSRRLAEVPLALIERALRLQSTVVASLVQANKAHDPSAISRGDLRLARIAQAYVETLGQRGQSQIIAKRFSYSAKSIPKLISRARGRGFLTGTTPGRVGGELTMLARMVLSQSDLQDHLKTGCR